MLKNLAELIQTQECKNIFNLTVLSILWGLQLLVAMVFVFSFFPIDNKALLQEFFIAAHMYISPEHELFFYRFFISVTVIIFILLSYICRRQRGATDLFERLKRRILGETILTVILTAVAIGWVLHPQAIWLKVVFYILATLTVLIKFLGDENNGIYRVSGWILSGLKNIFVRWHGGDVAFLMFLFAVIVVVDKKAVLAIIYFSDCFYHMDGFIMAPGWAYLSGLTLNIDVISQYGVFCVVAISRLAQLLGGLSYQNIVFIMMVATIAYFVLSYFFLRSWLKNGLLAATGIILGLEWQMFNLGTDPVIWRYPSATVLRYFFDIVFFILILVHIRCGKTVLLWLTAGLTGISVAYLVDTGTYQLLTLYAYLLMNILESTGHQGILKNKRKIAVFLGCLILPFIVAFGILWLIEGHWIFTGEFWHNFFEFIRLFMRGFANLPIYLNLMRGYLGAFLLGLLIPLTYVFTLISIGALYFRHQLSKEHKLAVLLSVYGLGLYHYYVCRSAPVSYLVVSLPFVYILCYWTGAWMERLEPRTKNIIGIILLLFSLVHLFDDPIFQKYPNIFHPKLNWLEAKTIYDKEFVFDQDESLIRELTLPSEKVALISSFEAQILKNTGRKPFFYYFPLIESVRMPINMFSGTYLFEKNRLAKTLKQLQQNPPRYFFVEKKLYEGLLPKQYYIYHESLTTLLKILYQNYEPYKSGQYLQALKLRGSDR